MADDNITIVINLDEEELNKQFKKIEKDSKIAGEKVGEAFSEGAKGTDGMADSIKGANKNIDSMIDRVTKIVAGFSIFVGVLTLLEKRFKLVSRILSKFGLSLDEIIEKGAGIKDAFDDLLSGEGSFNSLKFAAAGFLQEMGLIDSNLLKTIELLAKLGPAAGFVADNFIGIAGAATGLTIVSKNLKSITQLTGRLFNTIFKSGGLFGFISSLTAVGGALVGVGEALKATDNSIVRFSGTLIKLTGVLIGGFGVALGFAIIKISELAVVVGGKLVAFFQEATNQFNQAERSLVVFGATVENFNRSTGNAVGSTESWNKEIAKLSDTLNLSNESLTKSAQEIVQVGSALGLQENQLKKLLKVSAEFAKVNKKDVFDSTLAIVSGLNGSSQALQAYGVKLGAAAVQTFAYKQGLTKTLNELSENEVVQLRYNKLLKQYKNIAGISAVAAGTLADQQKRLELNQKRLTTALGEGARIVEDNSLIAAAFNTVLDNLNNTAFKFIGFFGALGARVLQIGGFILGFSFKIFAVIKAFKLLQVLLSSDLGIAAFAKNIPFLNQSLNNLISSAGGVQIEIKSLKTLLTGLGTVALKQGDIISRTFVGVGLKGLTFAKIITGVAKKTSKAFITMARASKTLIISLAPVLVPLALITGAVILLVKGFQLIESKTGALSTAFGALRVVFFEGASAFQPVIDLFKELGGFVLDKLIQGFGVLTFAMASAFAKIFDIIAQDPFGLISDDAKAKLTEASTRLKIFGDDLRRVAFDFRKLPDDASRGVAGLNEGLGNINLEALAALRKEFEDFGKTDLEKLNEQTQERLALVNGALAQELLTLEQFEELKNKILLDSSEKRFQLLNKSAIAAGKQITKTLQNGLVRGVVSATSKMGEALAGGKFSFKAFVGTVLGIIGDLLISLSGAFIAIGLGVEAIKASVIGLSGGQALAAGLALALLGGALKAFSSSLGGESSNLGGGAAPGSLSGGTPSDIASPDGPETDAGPGTQIAVNIQGDVLDSDETGTRIVSLINDAFDKDGAVVSRNFRTA